MAAESRLVGEIEARFGAMPGVVIFRNNIGVAEFHGVKVAYGVGGKGAPDLLVLVETRHGTFPLWVETKAPAGRLRPEQEKWHAAARRARWYVEVVRSVEEFAAAVQRVRDLAGVSL